MIIIFLRKVLFFLCLTSMDKLHWIKLVLTYIVKQNFRNKPQFIAVRTYCKLSTMNLPPQSAILNVIRSTIMQL